MTHSQAMSKLPSAPQVLLKETALLGLGLWSPAVLRWGGAVTVTPNILEPKRVYATDGLELPNPNLVFFSSDNSCYG